VKRDAYILIVIVLIFLAAAVSALAIGTVPISPWQLGDPRYKAILFVRFARIVTAIIAGAGLSALGAVLQSLLRNPLAEPYLLGASSGASLGAVLVIISGLSQVFLPVGGSIGALFSAIIVYMIAKRRGSIPTQSLILSGVIMSIALSSIIVFLISVAGNDALHNIMWWLWGSLEVYDLNLIGIIGGIVAAGILVMSCFSQDLNAISLGEESAIHLGVNVELVKRILFGVGSLIAGSLVALCGMIGFVGLIVPHIARSLVGPDHRRLMPASAILGATFMIVCDLISRVAFSPFEIPVGVITALVGTPIFIVVLKRSQKARI